MSPEDYERHRERVLYLSEHPLIDRADERPLEERQTRQATFQEVAD